MGEELGRCRFYGVEVVTLCRLEVTQRDKLIDAPWPELHTTCRMPSRRRSRCLRMRAPSAQVARSPVRATRIRQCYQKLAQSAPLHYSEFGVAR